MGTTVLTKEAVTAKARALRKGLSEMGVELKHTQAMELVARVEGETSWAVLRSKLAPAHTDETPTLVLVGAEKLLPGHVQVDAVPVSSFGGTRKDALYDAMRLCHVPAIGWDSVIEQAQRMGAFSAPRERLPLPAAGDSSRYDDDRAPCNKYHQTREQVVRYALEDVANQVWFEVGPVLEEFRARSGLVRCFRQD